LLIKATRVDSPPFGQPGRIQQLLKEHRLSANLSQADLAQKLGICKKTLWNWEAGLTKPGRKFWSRF
jgi:DNA-binding transcriptional regulator YiaG